MSRFSGLLRVMSIIGVHFSGLSDTPGRSGLSLVFLVFILKPSFVFVSWGRFDVSPTSTGDISTVSGPFLEGPKPVDSPIYRLPILYVYILKVTIHEYIKLI